MIVRLITEHIELNKYLYNKQMKSPSTKLIPSTPYYENYLKNNIYNSETVQHFILSCPKYKPQRVIMFNNLSKINHKCQYNKFRTIKYIIFQFRLYNVKINQQTKVWKEILSYTKHTQRFTNIYMAKFINRV